MGNEMHHGKKPEARDRARGDQRGCGFRREDFFLAKYHTVWYTLRESRTQAQRRRERAMALLTRRRWLQEGLALLEEAGAEALTIEAPTSRLDVTKGAFYHHFTKYQDFQESFLGFLGEEGKTRIVPFVEK